MKAYLVFKLPEEREEHELALNAGSYSVALWDIGQYLRKLQKYEFERVEKMTSSELLEEIRKTFFELTEGLDV